MPTPAVCLNMIVKNEAPVIRRCLVSVRPVIDCWVIVDTGSTDGTQEVIREVMHDLPGELHERPWRDFGHNRNEALELAHASTLAFDYLLFADADMELVVSDSMYRERLSAPVYEVPQRMQSYVYYNIRVLRRNVAARYVGVTHEYLAVEEPVSRLDAIWFIDHASGSNRVAKFERDARLLEEALRSEPGNARNVFYLAQSHRDAGNLARSLEVYEQRAQMGGWEEEVWHSLYNAAVLSEKLGEEAAQVSSRYLRAFQARPVRAEPLVQLARFHRERQEYAIAFLYAKHAAAMRRPADILFIEQDVYTWRALDELAVSANNCGEHDASRDALDRLLRESAFPETERARILRNAALYDIATA